MQPVTICEMISNHNEESFPFMRGPDARIGRHRTTSYQTVLRILFAIGGANFDSELEFTRFMELLRRKLELFISFPNKDAFRSDPPVTRAVIGVLRGLRGVVPTILSRKTYSLFFDWL